MFNPQRREEMTEEQIAVRLEALKSERARIEHEILNNQHNWDHLNELAIMLGEINEEEDYLRNGLTW